MEEKTFQNLKTHIRYGKKFFVVNYEGADYNVRLFPFQETQQEPEEIHCIVRTDEDGKVSIVQNVQHYLKKNYPLSEKSNYDFTVRRAYPDKKYYEVEDRFGFFFRLYTDQVLLERQIVTCKVLSISEGRLKLKLESSEGEASSANPADSPFNEHTLSAVIEKDLGRRPTLWDLDELCCLILGSNEPFERHAGKWVRKTLQAILYSETTPTEAANESEGETACAEANYQRVGKVLSEIQKELLFVLESTQTLNRCEERQRGIFQERITTLVEQCMFYISAAKYIEEGEHTKVIDKLFASLEASHYIYHASEKLELMMCIFTLLPDLMEQRMNAFFEIITGAEERYWKTDTFRRAFIRLLEFYVSELYDDVANIVDEKHPDFRNVFKALSIQLFLADPNRDTNLFDAQLNYARLCRMAACFPTGNTDDLLRRSVLSLADAVAIQASSCYTWADVNNLPFVAARLSEQVDEKLLADYSKSYLTDHIRLTADSSGISVAPLRCDSKQAVLPPEAMLWDRLQFFTEKKLNWPNAALTSLEEARRLWNDLERDLETRHSTIEQLRQARRKERPERGDEVRIAPYAIDPENPNRLLCRVEDDYYEGEGLLPGGNLAPYNVKYLNGINPFRRPNGEQLCVTALVEGITPDGRYIFSTKNVLQEDLKDIANFDEQLYCLVVSYANGGWVGFAENGLGVYFENGDEFNQRLCDNWGEDSGKVYGRPLIGKAVLVTLKGAAGLGLAPVEIEDVVDHVRLDQVSAVAYWANRCGEGLDEREVPTEEEEVFVANSLFTADQLDELMLVLDHVAKSEENLLRRYHYVSAARLLAKLTDRAERVEFYEKWRDLLGMLEFYSINHRLDEEHREKIDTYRASSTVADGHLRENIGVLYVLSCFDRVDCESGLLESTHKGESPLVCQLAAIVMAARLLSRDNFSQTHEEIVRHINELLHISGREERKSIGREDICTEFKTSIVYPPENHMEDNITQQTSNILRVLSAFYNTKGGTLYIGVNDHGIPVGISNDLQYKRFSNLKGKDQLDEYQRYIATEVRNAFSPSHTSADYFSVEMCDYDGKTVCKVCVLRPFPVLTRLDGVVYERQGSENVRLEGEQLAHFEKRRKERFEAERKQRLEAEYQAAETTVPEDNEAQWSGGEDFPTSEVEQPMKTTDLSADASFEPTIATATKRNNVLLDYMEDFISPLCFLTFSKNNSAKLSPEYYGVEKEDALTLAIHADEENAWLVLGYADGGLVRIPMKNVLDKDDYKELILAAESELVFATIAEENDVLLTFTADRNGDRSMRLDSVRAVSEGSSLQARGECLVKEKFDRLVNFEVLPESYITLLEEKKAKKKLLNNAGDGVGVAFACNEKNKYYKVLHSIGVDPSRDILANHE
jgi:divergent AAA domain